MPGTIHVSVLELMEASPAPTDAKTSTLSLKVTAGRREYQTLGQGELSLPVVSLRENLVVMLYSSDGNLMSRTELKTMSVVEKGTLDDTIPLEGGGVVHMRLQFLLSQEERQRIHELRNSKLRRKQGELLKEAVESDVSEEKVSDMMPAHSAEIEIEGSGISQPKHPDQYECNNSSGSQSLQDPKSHSQDSFENGTHKLRGPDEGKSKRTAAAEGIQVRDIFLDDSTDRQRERSATLISGNATEKTTPFSTKLEDHIEKSVRNVLARSTRSNVRKMITVFENSLSQGRGHHVGSSTSLVNKNQIEGSLKRISSEECLDTRFFHKTIAKSFSAERLSDIDLQDYPNFPEPHLVKKQEGKYLDDATNWEGIGKYKFIDFEQMVKNVGSSIQNAVEVRNDESTSVDFLHVVPSRTSESVIEVQKPTMTKENVCLVRSAEHASDMEKNYFVESEKNSSVECSLKDSCTNLEEMKSDVLKKEAYDLIARNSKATSDERFSSSHGQELRVSSAGQEPFVAEDMNDSAGSIEKHSTGTCRQECLVNSVMDFYCRFCRVHFKEQLASGYSFESTELFYTRTEEHLFGTFGIWVPRHLCITTGSKKLRNLLETCRICLRSLSVEEKFIADANEKEKMFSDSSADHEDLVGRSNLNGRLIAQGVRIIIVIVACGTLLLRAR